MKRKIKNIAMTISLSICIVSAATGVGISFQQNAVDAENTQSVRKYSDLWTANDGVTILDNVNVPSYAQSGYVNLGYSNDAGGYVAKKVEVAEREIWQLNGVQVATESESAIVEYANVIDITGFTENDHLIDVLPFSTTRNISRDFSQIKVWLYDADDSTNWVCVNLMAMDLKSYPGSLISVTTSNGFTGAYRWGNGIFYPNWATRESRHGAFYNVMDVDGVKDSNGNKVLPNLTNMDMLLEPYKIAYDVAKNAIYCDDTMLMDFDDTVAMGEGKEWKGFTNNRIRIGIQALGIENGPARYWILNVANHGMNGDKITDVENPYHYDLYENVELPTAMVGKQYKVLNANFYDFYDGAIDYEVYYKNKAENTFNLVNGDGFTPTKEGEYVLRFIAKDKAGNEDCIEYTITAKERINIEPLLLETDTTPIQGSVGEKILLPTLTIEGGCGFENVMKKVIRLEDNMEIDSSNGYFIPMRKGDYSIVYTVVDYVEETYSVSISCAIAEQTAPVIQEEITMYEKFIDKIKVVLPKSQAYDYMSMPGQRISAITEIVAKGTGSKSTYSQKIENQLFIPDIDLYGEQVVLEYKTYCKQYPDSAITRSFTVDIAKAEYVWDYFLADSQLTQGYNQKEEDKKYLSYTAMEDFESAEIKLVNPIRAEGFEFAFSVDGDKKNFDSVRIDLVDFENRSQNISLYIEEYTDKKSLISYKGKTSYMTGGFGTDSGMTLKYLNGAFIDYLGETIFELDDFGGFSSGKIWVTIAMVNATKDSQIKLAKVGQQLLGADYRSSGLTKFTDGIAPEIEIEKYISTSIEFNGKVTFPKAKAYDWCSGYVEVYLTVSAPDGTEILKTQKANREYSLYATQYGNYSVSYEARDDVGRKQTIYQSFSVEDTSKPVVIYNGEIEKQVRVNETLQFEDVQVYDNIDENLSVYVYIIQPNGVFVNITQERKYTFAVSGKHTLRYCAYDANFNYTWIDVTIRVK